ncbi:type VI secretion system baseplate subunit TssG [Curvibacter gracilis]|uniref:type VI secretion system baseplate subunit TssG n=1 Tax=Curvibacter gracilis TaxID=230310 RepID=UPI000A016261|nr:type VI secretion system baseplate subunit TssG [Curvibacter gracilis]
MNNGHRGPLQPPATAPSEAPTATSRPRQGLPDRLARAAQAPWRHGFLPLMRLLAAEHPEQPPIGRSQRPQQEPFRLGQQASLAFAPREIADISVRDGQAVIRLFGLGMLGPHGPLPLHVTEIVRERTEARRDATLSHFLDLFHHRYLTLFYRAWAQAQACAGLDRPQAETFTPYIARLCGDEVDEVPESPLPPHARWSSVAHRIREARNPDGLVATLAHYFGIGVTLQEFQLHWIPIEAKDTCLIGLARHSSLLGKGALAGEVVPDRQHGFRLILGPLDLRQYLRFTPQGADDGSDLPALIEWVRAFVGFEYLWEIALRLRREDAHPTRLGGSARLGWSSWMVDQAPTAPAADEAILGMVFEPERSLMGSANTPPQHPTGTARTHKPQAS